MNEALFEREYHTLVRLKHPRIIEVYDYGLTEHGPYYTMELLDGSDLQQLAPLPYREACRHLRDVASSLALLHAHRLRASRRQPAQRALDRGRSRQADRLRRAGHASASAAEIVGHAAVHGARGVAPLAARPAHRSVCARRDRLLGADRAPCVPRAQGARAAERRGSTCRLRPRRLRPRIPHALDALIMSLLSLDPLARPASAAAVIDQLTAIAALEPEEHEQAAESYLSSGQAGRPREERAWLQQRVAARARRPRHRGPHRRRLRHRQDAACCTRSASKLSCAGADRLRADAQASPAAVRRGRWRWPCSC